MRELDGCAGYLTMMLVYHKLGWISLPPGSCAWSRLQRYTSISPRQSFSGLGAIVTARSARFSGTSSSGALPLSKGVARLVSHDLEVMSGVDGWLLAAGQQGARARQNV